MQLLEVLVVTMALCVGLALIRFAMLAFLPQHPMSQFFARLDRLGGR